MTIKQRLWLMMVLFILSLLAVGATGYWVARAMGQQTSDIVSLGMPSIKLLNEADHEASRMRNALLLHIATADGDKAMALEVQVNQSNGIVMKALKGYEAYLDDNSPIDRQLWQKDLQTQERFYQSAKEVLALSETNKDGARQLYQIGKSVV